METPVATIESMSSDELNRFARTGERAEAQPEVAEPAKEVPVTAEPKAAPVETAPAKEADDDHKDEESQEPETLSRRELRRLIAQREYQRAKAELLEQQIQEARGSKGEEPKATPRAADGAPVEPKLGDFENYQQYEAAHAKYLDEKLEYLVERRERQKEAERQQLTVKERVEKFKESKPDFEQVADTVNLDRAPALSKLLFEHESALELVYHFGQNPQEFERIAAFKTPAVQMFELGRTFERLKAPVTPAPTTPKAKPISRAPEPVEPVGVSAAPAEPSEISDDGFLNPAWEKAHMAKLAARQ